LHEVTVIRRCMEEGIKKESVLNDFPTPFIPGLIKLKNN
jgi:hypothetical protein